LERGELWQRLHYQWRPAAYVLYAPVFRDPEVTKLCESVLTIAELQRAERFVSEHDKAHFKQRRAFRRFCGATALESSQPLQQVLFEETEKGRPFLSSLLKIVARMGLVSVPIYLFRNPSETFPPLDTRE